MTGLPDAASTPSYGQADTGRQGEGWDFQKRITLELQNRAAVVCVDLDSTLTDTRHRRHLCPTVDPASTWDAYNDACDDDAPVVGVITLVRMLAAAGYDIHIVTNRSDRFREKTTAWLNGHGVVHRYLAMRPPEMPLDDTDRWKLDYLRTARAGGFTVWLFIEDWPATANAIEASGVPVLCVNPRYTSTPVPQ